MNTAKDSFNRSLTTNQKIMYFFGAWLLTVGVLFDALTKFLNILNNIKVITLPEDYFISNIGYNDGVLLFILRLVVLILSAFCLGIVYSYLSRRVDISDIISLIFATTLFVVIFLPVFYASIALVFVDTDYSLIEGYYVIANAILSESRIYTGILIDFVSIAVASTLGVIAGKHLIEGLPEEKGKLLGVRWFHLIWLAPALSIYLQFLFYLIYLTIKSIVSFFTHFNIGKSFSGDTTSEYSLTSILITISIYYAIAYIVFILAAKQREVLDRNIKTPMIQKLGFSLLFALILPIVIIFFTAVGSNG